jgi:hypothetical protein
MSALSVQCYIICVNTSAAITSYHFYRLPQPVCLGALLTIWQLISLKFKRFLIQAQRLEFNISLLPHKRYTFHADRLLISFTHPGRSMQLPSLCLQNSVSALFIYFVTSDCRGLRLEVYKIARTSLVQQREILRTGNELLM